MTTVIHNMDCRLAMSMLIEPNSVHTCVTSPPYFGLRDYGHDGQIGLEPTPDEFVAAIVEVFREVRRVLRDDGTVWLNLGDSYWTAKGAACGVDPKQPGAHRGFARPQDRPAPLGLKGKDLIGIPWRVAFALQADGWYLRQDIIWAKPNPMPESVTDRCTKSHEYIFLLSKSPRYYFDHVAIKEPSVTNDTRRPYGSPGANAMDPRGAQGGGKPRSQSERPQQRRAQEIFDAAGLTEAHLVAIRSVGASDTGKALITQGGAGKNSAETQRLANEAKAALGGYFREFTFSETKNKRDVWTVPSKPYKGAHFATFPPDLIEPCILAGCPVGGTVLDPFGGAGTTALVATKHGRNAVLCELNAEYVALAEARLAC